jgi:uncharacterized short protein YbdD (DUF466 family)
VNALAAVFRKFWAGLRAVTGDDAYERYLAHCRERHPGSPPLGRRAFYAAELDRRWEQVNRCC